MQRSETMIKLASSRPFSKLPQTKFTMLTGDVLDIIGEYLSASDNPTQPYIFTNSIVLKNFSDYKRENYSIQNEILHDQIGELKKELFDYFDQKLFKMSKGLSIIYYSNINSKEWVILEDLAKEKQLGKDDLVMMKVYILLLGY